jgi:hypothetical protein
VVVTMVRRWAQPSTITAAEAPGRQAKARSRRVVSSASRSTSSILCRLDANQRPHGITGTAETEFWGEPSMILSLIAR